MIFIIFWCFFMLLFCGKQIKDIFILYLKLNQFIN